MRLYVKITGFVFAAIVLAHLARVAAEGWHRAVGPAFLLSTLVAAGLAVWAWRLLRKPQGGET